MSADEMAMIDSLVAAREAKGLTQQQVAEALSTDVAEIERFEAGMLDARMSFLRRYARLAGVLVQHEVEEAPITYDRETLIHLCEAASVPQEHWHNRDSAIAQRQVGEALMLLRAGCDFRVLTGTDEGPTRGMATDADTAWVEITYNGFSHFEGGEPDDDTFYIPTRARLDAADGKDWY